ncbi:MAG: HlyD family efflux transporter periplasmic adaptor subunit [Clostridia bacterium]|nr:HlyD family efflux transporter periplasmic adaptor subunit [Clostridia bacterium]
MKDSAARRAWVKNIAIIFLVILLLLTFFSRTILNYSLPEVSAQYAQYATLTTAVKTQGTVKANESYNVVFEEKEADGGTVQSRKVVSVYVKEGDTVEKDAPILALSGGPSVQLDTARKDYEEKKKAYELALLSSGADEIKSENEVASKKREIQKAEDKLAELKEEYKESLAGGDPVKSIESAIERLEARIKTIKGQIKECETSQKSINKQSEALAKEIKAAQDKLSEAEGKRDAAKQKIEEDILSKLTISEKLAVAQDEYDIAERTYNTLKAEADLKKADVDELSDIVKAISANEGDINKANELTNQIKQLEEQINALYLQQDRKIEDYNKSLNNEYSKNDDLYIAYNKAYSEYTDYKNRYASEISDIESLKAEIAPKQARLNALSDIVAEKAIAKAALDDITATLEAAWGDSGVSDERIEKLEAEQKNKQDAYDIACEKYDENIDAYDSLSAEVSQLNEELSELEGYKTELASLETAYKAAEKALDNADTTINVDPTVIQRELEDLDKQIVDLENQLGDAKAKLYHIDMPEVDDVIDYAYGYDLETAKTALDKATEAYTEATKNLEDVAKTYEDAKTKLESLKMQSIAEETANQYQVEVNTYQAQVDALNGRQEAFDNQIESLKNTVENYEDQIKDIEDDIAEKEKEKTKAESKKGREPEEIEEDIETQEDSIRKLKEAFEEYEASEKVTDTESDQKLEAQKKEIEELEKKIKEYENAPENTEVLAPIAGRVVSVSFVPGDTVTSGNTVASIEIADKGYVVEISMPAEEARRIQVGSPCTVTNSWWYSNITASVAQVRSDPKSQGKNRIIVINVSGDVSDGQSLNFSIGDRSQSYDSVLPNSAIRDDNDGKFVLTVEAKKTPLGNRYIAKRTNIEILASDDTQSAVSGLYGSEFVITSSTTPITDGQQVRLAGD